MVYRYEGEFREYSFTGGDCGWCGSRRYAPSHWWGRPLEGVGDHGVKSSKHRGDEWGKVELTLLGSAHDAGEDLLRVGAVTGAIATAHLAGYHRGADGLFGAPVGRIHRRVPEKGEQGGELGGQMVGEALGGDQSRWRVDQPCEFGEESVAGSDELVVGQAPGVASVAQFQRILQDHLHIASPRAARMVVLDFPAASEQVRQTVLLARGVEAAIHHPPVPHEHAVEIVSQDGDGVVEPAAGKNRVDGRRRRGEYPQPVADSAHAPPGLIRRDHVAFSYLPARCGVGRRRITGGAMQQIDEASRRDGQAEAGPEQVGHLRQRRAHLRVHLHGQGGDFGPQLHASRPQCVRCLQCMAALDTLPALRAVADLDVQAPHNGPHHREIFLILRCDALYCDRTAAIWTLGRHRCLMDFVDLRRPPATRRPPLLRTGAPSRTFATTLPSLFGEGRRLAQTRAPRRVKLPLEPSCAALPAIPVALGGRQILAQLRVLTLQFFDTAVPRVRLPPGSIRVIGLPRCAHTEGIGSEAPHLQSDRRLSCRDPLTAKRIPSRIRDPLFRADVTALPQGPTSGRMGSVLRPLPDRRSLATKLTVALLGLCLIGLTLPRATASALSHKTTAAATRVGSAEPLHPIELPPPSLPSSVLPTLLTYAAPNPGRRLRTVLAFFSWHRLGRILEPLVDLLPGGGIGRSLVRNIVASVPAPASERPSLPTNASEVASLEEEAEARRRTLEAALAELRKETESRLQGLRGTMDANAGELSEELEQLEDLSSTTLQAIRDIDDNLGSIDRNLVDVGENLRGIGSNLELVYQNVTGFSDRLDGIQGQIADDMRRAMDMMANQLVLARESNQRMSDLQAALDTYARTTLLASGANAILLVLLLVLVLKLERNTRYAIDLMKVMLAEFNIPIPDSPVGLLGRLRSWCSHRRHWRWLPSTVGLAGRALVAAVIVMAALAILGLEYDESQLAAWPAIGLGTAALLVARQRVPRSERLGPPVLALIPADVGEAGGFRRILVRDNGLGPADGGFVLGRHAPLVDAVVANSSVSRRHARILRERNVFYVEDLNSSNGTQVNGAQLEPFRRRAIAVEDQVRLGRVKLSVESVQVTGYFS